MTPSKLKEAVRLSMQSRVPLMVWGHHGVAKSSVVRQVADEDGIGFVDFRCSQIEPTDLRGWPSRIEENGQGMTVYNPPAELPRDPDSKGIFFLDELNRADDPVIQAVFQLITERRIGTYKLPDGWHVVTACNFTEGYHVNDFCSAFIGRFAHVEVQPATEGFFSDWASYTAKEFDGSDAAAKVIQFLAQDLNNIGSKKKTGIDFTIEPSPRLWSAVVRLEEAAAAGDFDRSVLREMRMGLIGSALAIAFEKATFEITPKDILTKGVKAVQSKLDNASRDQRSSLAWGVLAIASSCKPTETKVRNTLDLMEYFLQKDRDLAVVMVLQLFKEFGKNASALAVNPALAEILGEGKGGKSLWYRELAKRQKLFEFTKTIREKAAE